MDVHYRFQSSKILYTLPIHGDSIHVADFNLKILNAKFGGNGKGFHFVVTNADTEFEYKEDDDANPIPKNVSLIIRRRPNIIFNQITQKHSEESSHQDLVSDDQEDSFDFGEDPLSGLEIHPKPNPTPTHFLADEVDEDIKIKAFIESSAADWQNQLKSTSHGCHVWRKGDAKGFKGFEPRIPPQGYVCKRCEIPGHFIQHCPTNGDHRYDKKEVRNPKGIPKHMLVADPEGSCALGNGVRATLKPNEGAFDKQMEELGLLSSTSLPVRQENPVPTVISVSSKSYLRPEPTFRQVIFQKIASSLAASSKVSGENPKARMQDKEQNLHSRNHADEETKKKRQKTNFDAPHCMPLGNSTYYGNWNNMYGMHMLPPQLGH